MAGQCQCYGFDQEIGDRGMGDSVLFELITEPLCLRHVDLARQIKMWYGCFALCRRSRDGLPHLTEGLVRSSRQYLRRRLRFHDILFHDAPAGTGSADGREVNPTFGSQGFCTGRGWDTGALLAPGWGGCRTGSRWRACLCSTTDSWRGSDPVGQCRGDVLIRFADDTDQRPGHHGRALLHEDFSKYAGGKGLEIHDGLVGFNLRERLPCLNRIPLPFLPRKENTLFHRIG